MFLKNVLTVFRFLIASAVLVLATAIAALAQDSEAEPGTDLEIDVFDEIIVSGERTLGLLREEVYAAEDDFYELFNSLNDGKQFDINCFYRTPVGSQVRRRVCEPNFVKSEYMPPGIVNLGRVPLSDSTVQSLSNGGGGNSQYRSAFVAHKSKQMQKIMAAMIEEHPELRAALMKFSDSKQTLDVAIRDRCANSPLLCKD